MEWCEENKVAEPEEDLAQIDPEVWSRVFRKAKPWRATGYDQIHAFWWKRLTTALVKLFDRVMGGELQVPPAEQS